MMTATSLGAATIETVRPSVYVIPTDAPESDGTLEWTSTTLVVAEVTAGDEYGIGYTYADRSAGTLIANTLSHVLRGRDALATEAAWHTMVAAVRNAGRPGVASSAIAAVDIALWDLKARLLGVPLLVLLGAVHEGVLAYGSGGFTSYDDERLHAQLGGWVASGITRVKMKVGRNPMHDLARVRVARDAIGPDTALFVDANGAYSRKQALAFANAFAAFGVTWFEEPVSSDDLEGLRLLRNRAPGGMDIAAGEYGYDAFYFRRMLEAEAVDVLQADATRCAGISGFMRVSALCEAFALPLSAHTAPTLHTHVGCASLPLVHVEYFHDHARIEQMLFDGAIEPIGGRLHPDLSRPGLGIELKRAEAVRFAV